MAFCCFVTYSSLFLLYTICQLCISFFSLRSISKDSQEIRHLSRSYDNAYSNPSVYSICHPCPSFFFFKSVGIKSLALILSSSSASPIGNVLRDRLSIIQEDISDGTDSSIGSDASTKWAVNRQDVRLEEPVRLDR